MSKRGVSNQSLGFRNFKVVTHPRLLSLFLANNRGQGTTTAGAPNTAGDLSLNGVTIRRAMLAIRNRSGADLRAAMVSTWANALRTFAVSSSLLPQLYMAKHFWKTLHLNAKSFLRLFPTPPDLKTLYGNFPCVTPNAFSGRFSALHVAEMWYSRNFPRPTST